MTTNLLLLFIIQKGCKLKNRMFWEKFGKHMKSKPHTQQTTNIITCKIYTTKKIKKNKQTNKGKKIKIYLEKT
jgi:hypothetical protein